MKLRDKLYLMNPQENVKIGADKGTGWIYTGTVEGFLKNPTYKHEKLIGEAKDRAHKAIEQLRKQARNMPTETDWDLRDGNTYSEALAKWGGKLSKSTMRTAAVVECLEKYTPLIDREIKEVFPAIGEKATNIVVVGADRGDPNLISVAKVDPLSADMMSDKGAELITVAVYSEVIELLKCAYRRVCKAYEKKQKPKRDDLLAVRRHENWIRRDVYGILGDANGIIKSCKQAVRDELKEEKEALKNEEAEETNG